MLPRTAKLAHECYKIPMQDVYQTCDHGNWVFHAMVVSGCIRNNGHLTLESFSETIDRSMQWILQNLSCII